MRSASKIANLIPRVEVNSLCSKIARFTVFIMVVSILSACARSIGTTHQNQNISSPAKGDSSCTSSRSYHRKNYSQQVKTWIPKGEIHKITSTSSELYYDDKAISPIITNPKDGMQDLPDSVWEGFYIGPIKKMAQNTIGDNQKEISFIYSSPDNAPYAYAKPLFRSLTEAGIRWVYIPVDANKYFPIEMINDKESTYVVHSGDSTGYNSIIQIQPDSILLYVNSVTKNGNRILGLPTHDRSQFNREELNQLESALINEISSRNYLQWIGIDPHPSTPFRKIAQILKVLHETNDKKLLKIGLNATIYGVYIPWE